MAESKRIDIQALRGLAIFSVLVNHLPLPRQIFESGFRGVDIFFVISGFVITNSLIRQSLKRQKISPVNFLLQRVRRLYPAFFVVMIANLIILISNDWLPYMERGVIKSAMAGTWYFQNFWMLNQNFSYFEPSFTNPFTHMWSLSVEEQFYLLVSFGLLILRFIKNKKFFTFIATLFLFALSALASLKWGETVSPIIKFSGELSAFLLPQYRAWQLLLGVLVACAAVCLQPIKSNLGVLVNPRMRSVLYISAIAVIAISLKLDEPARGLHSAEFKVQLFATTICAATALILFLGSFPPETNAKSKSANLIIRVATFFGDRSYSLYLVHWPIIVLLPEFYWQNRYLWIVELVAILLCTEIIYQSVEWVWLNRSLNNRKVFSWFLLGQIILTSGIVIWRHDFSKVNLTAQGKAINGQIDSKCGRVELPFKCVIENESDVTILVEGDSFALMVTPLILELANKYQIRVAFGIDMADLPLHYYENTEATAGKKLIVLSWFNHYETDPYIAHISELLSQNDTLHVFAFLNGPTLTGERLRKISRAELIANRDREPELKSALLLPEFKELTVIDPLNSFCNNDICSIQSGEQIFLSDHGHLSSTGVEILRPLFEDIFQEIKEIALDAKNR
ncbi:MAG: acyltransferase family protein [Actinobacteria bacterium]|uniref:Unannotated protein n=1 Tax=freshwater metagenome TaxID=449393 RepID=A0A6J6V0X3_9ZZZZ|nr:acyltransferase family protein [Actinomycetota bacterium]